MGKWASCLAVLLAVAAAASANGQPAAAPRAIDIVASGYEFAPAVVQVAAGERIVLRARASDGKAHGIAIKELKVKAALPKTGEVVPIEFTADKAGTYTIACSVYCGSGHSRMKARLVVAEKKQ